MGNETFSVSIPGRKIRVNGEGTNGRYSKNKVKLTMRKYGKRTTRVTLRVKDPALEAVVGEELLVRVALPGRSASGLMSCFTKYPDRRQVTNCKVD